MGQLDAVLQARGICRVYYEAAADLEKNLDKILAKCRKAGVTLYAALPRVAREWNAEAEQPMIDRLIASEIDGFWCVPQGSLHRCRKAARKLLLTTI